MAKFQFTRYFGIQFLLIEIVIVGAAGALAYRIGRSDLIAGAEQNSAAVARHLAWALDKFYMLPWNLSIETFPYENPIAREELQGVVETFVGGFNVERVSIIDRTYRVIFSTDSSFCGSDETSNSMVLSALAGNTVSKLVKEQTPEHMATASGLTDHLLAYVPVETRTDRETTNRVAFEILMNVGGAYEKVEELRNIIIVSTTAMGLALLLVVWLIARRADRIVVAEYRERMTLADQIRKQNEELELIVSQRTQQLRDAQAGLLQMEKMAATGQLAAGVAHEINNPVGIIQNRLEILLDEVRAGQAVGNLESHLSLMHRHVDRISKIVSRLLSFARKSATGKSSLNIGVVSNGVTMLVGKEIEKRGITFIHEVPDNLPPVLGNSTEIEQVLVNLLVNAMDATDSGGQVRLSAAHNNDRIQIQISDSGSGIASENLSKIFDPFFTTKGVGLGTGLGLSIVYRIVEDHGGSIIVASEEGQGTTFTVYLPIHDDRVQS